MSNDTANLNEKELTRMRIGLDLRMIGGGSGIDRYITELFKEVLVKNKTNEFVLFFRDQEQANHFEAYGHKAVITGIRHYSFAEQWKLPKILSGEKLDLVHFPHFNVPILYRGKFIVTIHDLTHTLIPGKKKSRFFHRLAYHCVFWNAVKSAHKIIAVSNSTKKSIIDYYHVDSEKIKVIYEGFSAVYSMMDKELAFQQVSNRFGTSKPYILFVGAWRRYKNLPMLAKAFEKLVDKGQDLELVLAGEEDKFYPEIKDQITDNRHSDRIKIVGRVTDDELKLLYNAATLFVLPSLMEGFGLTALEAAACGVPMACSDIPTLREIMGQGAEYFDPNNLENMTDVISQLTNSPLKLEELSNRALGRARHFSWQKAATETLETYA